MNPKLIALTSLLTSTMVTTSMAGSDADALKFFETQIRPLLAENCFDCHGRDKQKGGLRLDHIEHIRAGGHDHGPALTDDKVDDSPLIVAVEYQDPDFQMPPDQPLTSDQVDLLKKWVAMGAPWPEESLANDGKYKPGVIGPEERAWWAFLPLKNVNPPAIAELAGLKITNDVDRFVFAKLQEQGLTPAPAASPEEWIRRVYFDLHGLPPTPDDVIAFVEACDAAAGDPKELEEVYEFWIDQLLASPRYGERWAQHWLDIARYGESDGYRQDAYRPHAWAYRDYVIRSFNDDKPYNQFIREQIAGDEIAPNDPDVFIGTAFLRHTIYEYNQRDVEGQRTAIMNEITDVTADVFMGLSVQCAQCHDHKFDPILHKDYYRLQAFLSNTIWDDNRLLAREEQISAYNEAHKKWEDATQDIREVIDSIVEPKFEVAAAIAMGKFPEEIQEMHRKEPSERSPYEQQLLELAYRQLKFERERLNFNKLSEENQKRLKEAQLELEKFDLLKPQPLTPGFVIGETGPIALPATYSTRKSGKVEVAPGFLTILHPEDAVIPPPPQGAQTSGRRTVLANWLADDKNPLSTRVIVNRVWQYHLGRGIAATTSDFGRLGETPSHPELLDWLTRQFLENGWHLKPLHKAILMSSTYRQTARRSPDATIALKDPENKFLWRFNPRRLDAEEVRDAILAASGELDFKPGGEGQPASQPRRSIYVRKLRNTQDDVLRSLDAPAGFASTPKRDATTTATQSLLLFNGSWPLERAQAIAARLTSEHYGDPSGQITRAYQLAYSRRPTTDEHKHALKFLEKQTTALEGDSIPPPPPVNPVVDLDKHFPARIGNWLHAAEVMQFKPGTSHEKLRVNHAAIETERFFVEAVVNLDSLYPDASVRTIVSRWDNGKQEHGWAFGVTSKKSAHQPNNLIVQLSGDDFQGTHAYEVVASNLRIPVNKPYYVAASIDNRPLEGKSYGGSVTFYTLDLSDPNAIMQTVVVAHEIVGGYVNEKHPLVIGGRSGESRQLWDGAIAHVRLGDGMRPEKSAPLAPVDSSPTTAHVNASMLAQPAPDAFIWETSNRAARSGKIADPAREALTDFCHTLINSNEFFYLH